MNEPDCLLQLYTGLQRQGQAGRGMAPKLQPPRLHTLHAPIHAEKRGLELPGDAAGVERAGDDGAPVPRQKPGEAKFPVRDG